MSTPRISRWTSSLVLILGLACTAAPAPPSARDASFIDAEGQPVRLEKLPVTRVVSTMQSATEWLIALGARDLIVARTDFDRQPELATLPSIGGGLDPSPEAIANLHPDVILGWQNRSSSDLQKSLAPFHIPVISLETADTADLFRHLASLGVLAGKTARADSLAEALRADLRSIKAGACTAGDTARHETVMVILSTDPAMTAGGGTWLNTVLETACLENAFGELSAPWPTVALEAIIARQPDWLLTSTGIPGQRLAELRSLTGWKELRAVREGRVLEVSTDLISRAGPSIAEAARRIVAERQAKRPER